MPPHVNALATPPLGPSLTLVARHVRAVVSAAAVVAIPPHRQVARVAVRRHGAKRREQRRVDLRTHRRSQAAVRTRDYSTTATHPRTCGYPDALWYVYLATVRGRGQARHVMRCDAASAAATDAWPAAVPPPDSLVGAVASAAATVIGNKGSGGGNGERVGRCKQAQAHTPHHDSHSPRLPVVVQAHAAPSTRDHNAQSHSRGDHPRR